MEKQHCLGFPNQSITEASTDETCLQVALTSVGNTAEEEAPGLFHLPMNVAHSSALELHPQEDLFSLKGVSP